MKQIHIIQPKVIVALGSPSAKFLLDTSVGITKLRGNWGEWGGIPGDADLPSELPASKAVRDESPSGGTCGTISRKVLVKLGRAVRLKQKE